MAETIYMPENFSQKEVDLIRKFKTQLDDARQYFLGVIKPRLDRSYKLYIADNTDRAKEIQKWQANIAIPYVHAVVETLKPRILDARPEFTVQGRTNDDQDKASRLQYLNDYTWEISEADKAAELITSSALIYGTGFMQVGWKKDVRKHKFLSTNDLLNKKYKWEVKEQVFYDAPFIEWVDNYNLWYDWHNVESKSKQYWFKRLVLTGAEIKRRYPMAEKKRLDMALTKNGGDLEDYGSIRTLVKLEHEKITKGADYRKTGGSLSSLKYQNQNDSDLRMYEVFEWLRPFEDSYAVMVGEVPILKGAEMPMPYDFKEAWFIDVPYLRIPGEFEGYGLPMLLENPQIMLNMIKNQRLDAMTLTVHKMWIINPLSNIEKEDLVSRPMGIIYSIDPQGAREVQMSDIKPSAYKEEESLKSDMRYGSGVDDFSMAVGGNAASATEVRHLRESTLERVRLFINHLGEGYSKVMRYWISMYKQFWTKEMMVRVAGDDGEFEFPIIEKDDLMGQFDFKASVIPSIAGQNDVKKKQDMDLFQLLIALPFVDPEKLVTKILHDWNWNINSIKRVQEEMAGQMPGADPMAQGLPPGAEGLPGMEGSPIKGGKIASQSARDALGMLGSAKYAGAGAGQSPMGELGSPVNLLGAAGPPPTPKGIPAPSTSNPRGFNRGGKVNTNIPLRETTNPEAQLMNQSRNIQS